MSIYGSNQHTSDESCIASFTPPKPAKTLPPTDSVYKRPTYRTGNGDVLIPQRVGSDHSLIKSKGFLC